MKEELKSGVWYNDLSKMPIGKTLLLYCGEIYTPGVGTISEDGEVISTDTEYNNMPIKDIESFMLIPDC